MPSEPDLFQASPFAEDYPLSREQVESQQVCAPLRRALPPLAPPGLCARAGVIRRCVPGRMRPYGAATWTTSSPSSCESTASTSQRPARPFAPTCSMCALPPPQRPAAGVARALAWARCAPL